MKRLLILLGALTLSRCAYAFDELAVRRAFTEPYQRIDVAAAELGTVSAVLAKPGLRVKRGDVIGQLNQEVLRAARAVAIRRAASRAAIDLAEAEVTLHRTRLTKLRPLLESGHANPQEVEHAQTELRRALAALAAAEEERELAELEVARIEAQLRQREIRSPIDGEVIHVYRAPGEFLSAADPRFATVVDVSRLRAHFYLPPDQAATLVVNQAIPIWVQQQTRRVVPGRVAFVSPVTESDSGTVRVDIVIDNAERKLRSGTVCGFDTASPQTEEGN